MFFEPYKRNKQLQTYCKNSAFYNVLAIYQDKVFKGSIYGVPIKIDTRVGY